MNLPAGIGKQGDTEYTVRSLGWFTSPQDIANTPLIATNNQLVRVGDVATVRDAHTETRVYTRENGEQAVGMSITPQSDANDIATKQAVYEKLALVRQASGATSSSTWPTIRPNSSRNPSRITQRAHRRHPGGADLLFFLRNVRSTLVVALSIPTSIISTFALIYLCGFT